MTWADKDSRAFRLAHAAFSLVRHLANTTRSTLLVSLGSIVSSYVVG